MSQQTFAQLSNGFVYGAMAVLTLAMFAYAAELAFGTRSRVGRGVAALAAQESRVLVGAEVGPGSPSGDAPVARHLSGDDALRTRHLTSCDGRF